MFWIVGFLLLCLFAVGHERDKLKKRVANLEYLYEEKELPNDVEYLQLDL